MRKFFTTVLSLAISLGAFNMDAQNNADRINQAMMQAYEQLLKEDPNNYEALYRRASEYYRRNQYLRALQDINKALELTPGNESELRFFEYALRANIYDNTGEPEKALQDLNSAIAINPDNYVVLYQKANTEFELNRLEQAKASYRKLQALNPRSLESLFGLSRIAVKEQNYGLANELADKAVNANPSQADAYIRRASIRSSMGNNTGAVDDLILALSTDNSDGRAIREIVAMGNRDYPATITGLTSAIQQAPKVGMYRYLRAMIEQAHYRYKDAIDDFKVIIDENLYQYPGLFASMAECEYALGRYAQASTDVEYAIGATADNAGYYDILSSIRRAQWRDEEALDAAEKSLAKSSSNNDGLYQKALSLVALKRYDEASDAIGEAILNDSEKAIYLMVRGWVLSDFMNQKGNAKIYYQRVLDLDQSDPESFTGFAHLFLGDKAAGEAWINKMLTDYTDNDGRINYIAACFYAQAGDATTALAHMDEALKRGYANYHDWTQADVAKISVAPIRDDARFNDLLQKYKSIF